jgi:peptidylprolyl isomerase
MGEKKSRSRIACAAALCLAVIPLSSCTTDGGSSTRKAPVSTSDSSASSINFPVVQGAPGSAPTIIAPHGAPPASLESKDLVVGNGATVTPTSSVTVHYLLMGWKSGKIIDSSWSRGTPATFGLNQVIPGWQKGMPGMKVGGRRELLVPPSLGYGEAGSGPVGPNETLIFVIDLVAVN